MGNCNEIRRTGHLTVIFGKRGVAAIGRALFICLSVAGGAASASECALDRADLRWPDGSESFTVEIADDAQERARGLMFRKSMPADAGMLFVYPEPVETAFWMENTLIPLDIIFADAHGKVIRIHENAVPLDRTALPSGGPIRFVLEINGGLSARLGLKPGAELRHPAIGSGSLWPCD